LVGIELEWRLVCVWGVMVLVGGGVGFCGLC